MTQKEQTELLDKIRGNYDTLISFYRKKPDNSLSFERRYSQICYDRGNLEHFLKEELLVVEKMIIKEESFFQETDDFEDEIIEEPAESFADRIMGELQQKQDKYPPIRIHKYAAPEISRLYGALKQLSNTDWSEIIMVLDKTFPGMRNGALVELEHTFHRLISSRGDGLPTSLERYQRLLDYEDASAKDLQREVQNLIKDASFFLHDLKKFLTLALSREVTQEKVSVWLEKTQAILSDFRLKDIHRSDQ